MVHNTFMCRFNTVSQSSVSNRPITDLQETVKIYAISELGQYFKLLHGLGWAPLGRHLLFCRPESI